MFLFVIIGTEEALTVFQVLLGVFTTTEGYHVLLSQGSLISILP